MVESPALSEVARAAQRRQLTVMFCDLVDSTPMAARFDPEDTAEVYRAFRDLCAAAIEAAGGYVAKYMGDGVMAYFGYPTAHEDNAERAVHAAIRIVRSTPEVRAGDARLAARIGIATGLVVVGDLVGELAKEAHDVVGETPNLAARLQAAAAPNEILTSSLTQRLAAGLFAFQDAGRPALKGIKLKGPVWRVIGARTAADRFRARRSLSNAPMIGREAELKTLLEAWRASQSGEVRVVAVVGEAGIGKSRLLDEFHRVIARRAPHIWLEGGGVQLFGNTPFYPIAQAINRRLTDGQPLAPDALHERLAHSLAMVGMGGEALTLVAELIDAAPPGGRRPAAIAAEQRRRALIDALAGWLFKSAERWPTVLAIEDLQWVDPSTIEFLETLIARTSAKLMIVYTARPDAGSPWTRAETRISLGPLDRERARNLVTAASARALRPDLLERIVTSSGGVPLFAEELALLVADEPGEASPPIPSALSDLLMARLDQVGSAKELAQIVAVLGGNTPPSLIGAVAGLGESELTAALDTLIDADLLVAHNADDRRTYAFRHSLIETTAYETLLRRVRSDLHRRAAEAMLNQLPEQAERQPAVLAHHWLKAGEHAKAVSAWRRAAVLALERHALREATHAAEEGIAIVRSIAATPELERDEIYLQDLLAEAARGLEGYASPKVFAALERARALAVRHSGVADEMQRLLGEWAARSSTGDYKTAAPLGDAYVRLARANRGEGPLGFAQMILLTRYRQGDLTSAEAAFQAGKPYFVRPDFLRQAGAAGQAFGSGAKVAWLLGLADEAERRSEQSLEVCRAAGPYDLAYARHMAAQLSVLRGDSAKAERLASENILAAESSGYASLASLTRISLGRALVALDRAVEGAALIKASLLGPGERSLRASQTLYLTWFAEALIAAGDTARGAAVLEEALIANPGEIYFRPETLRVRGDLAHTDSRFDAAEADYQAAIELGRSIGAAVLVQRALSSLAGLRRSQRRRGEVRQSDDG